MKKLILFFLAACSLALGQGNVVAPKTVFSVVNGVTRPIANATITVCAANTSGIPCSPVLAGALFQDAALTQSLPNPFQADANGNYNFAIATGSYTVTETGTGFAGYSYQLTVGGAGVNTGVPCQVAYYSVLTGILSPQSNLCFSGSNSNFTGTLNVASDGVHPGLIGIFGQTTPPTLPANSVSWIGPPLASFTSYGLQFPSTAPSGTQTLGCGTPASGISSCAWSSAGGVTGSGTTNQLAVWTGASSLGNAPITATASQVQIGFGGNFLTSAQPVYFGVQPNTACTSGASAGPPMVPGCGVRFDFTPTASTGISTAIWAKNNSGGGASENIKMGGFFAVTAGVTTTEERGVYAEAYDTQNSTTTTRRGLFAFAGNNTGNTSTNNEAIVAQTLVGTLTTNTNDFTIHILAPTVSGTMTTHAGLKIDTQGVGVPLAMGTQIFSALPSCNGTYEGSTAPLTDSTTVTWGATITGGGTNHVLAYCDGTAWTVAAK